jgi:hypothetical protein
MPEFSVTVVKTNIPQEYRKDPAPLPLLRNYTTSKLLSLTQGKAVDLHSVGRVP